MKTADPDQRTEYLYPDGSPMDEHVVVLRKQLDAETTRLIAMLKCAHASRTPCGYAKAYLWISTKDQHRERSEFSKRLAKARALYEALIALQSLNGIEQPVVEHDGPWSTTDNQILEDEDGDDEDEDDGEFSR